MTKDTQDRAALPEYEAHLDYVAGETRHSLSFKTNADRAAFLKAALQSPRPRDDVPAGYVLVPVEPTEEMKTRGAPCMGPFAREGKMYAEACYRAMIRAAPKPDGGA